MPAPETLLAVVVLVALTLYALGGGADFGGGVWDLFSRGAAGERQRAVITHAIGPVWEANHVWLILVIVLMFVGFPYAFAGTTTALHIPLTLVLVGIVLRGAAFTFRHYDSPDDRVQRRWSRLFAIASIVTPVMLGVCAGAIASGTIRVDPLTGRVHTDFLSSWLAPFPFALGAFVLALFAFLAATYLTLETEEREVRVAFRLHAILAAVVCGVLAWVCVMLSSRGAPMLHDGLLHRRWSLPFQLVTAAAAIGALAALWVERWRLARALAIGQVTLVVWGWGLSQFPWLIDPDLTIHNAAAPDSVLVPVLWALAAGTVVLLPSLAWLFRVFKRGAGAGDAH